MAASSNVESESNLKKGLTKDCCWALRTSDSRYPKRMPAGTYFIRFPKSGKVKETLTKWEQNVEN